MSFISIRGARTHNLKNISLDIPKNKLVVITGLSGSGKSSLAFDTLYAEGSRRYAESVNAYARQFMDIADKPDIDSITGLTPTIAISQASAHSGTRSTVGTLTEIADYARILFARAGIPFCPQHDLPLTRSGIHDMVDAALELEQRTKVAILAPVREATDKTLDLIAAEMGRRGYMRLRVNGTVMGIDEVSAFKKEINRVEVVVDRLRVSDESRSRLAESFEAASKLSGGQAILLNLEDGSEQSFNLNYGCPECGFSVPEMTPAMFSFNNALGACPVCEGRGIVERFNELILVKNPKATLREGAICGWGSENHKHFGELIDLAARLGFSVDAVWETLTPQIQSIVLHGDTLFCGVIPELERQWSRARSESTKAGLRMLRSVQKCPECQGKRFRREVHHIYVGNENRLNMIEFSNLTLCQLLERLSSLTLDAKTRKIGEAPLEEIKRRLRFLIDVGLGYLTLSREVKTLSGGELQRIRLAGQISSGLTGVTYVLDEPTIGLHQQDTEKLIQTMKQLVACGNSVVVVEHDTDVIRAADWVIDIGPGAGELGGELVAQGPLTAIIDNKNSLTGAYIVGRKKIESRSGFCVDERSDFLTVVGARGHNLKNLTCRFPVGALISVTGVSGSGKSTLVMDTLTAALRRKFYRTKEVPLECDRIDGTEHFDKIVVVDQSAIGRTPRSNPATYTGLFNLIRDVFSETLAAKERGYGAGRFSFNTAGGRCEACEGDGNIKVEMGFLPAVYVTCTTCQGRRYNRETLEVKYKGKSIADVLEMTVTEAMELFAAHPLIMNRLKMLSDVGLGYIRLGQSATTFSGGEAQRIKLAEELAKRPTGRTLYVLDEPTTGLHFEDVSLLLKALRALTDNGNTVIVIEHNLEMIRASDWIVDIGPGGGEEGGQLVAEGILSEIIQCEMSATGRWMKSKH